MRNLLQRIWNFITEPINRVSKALIRSGMYWFELEESNRMLGFALLTTVMSFVVYFTTNSDLGWTILFGGGQVFSFLYEGLHALLYQHKYRPNFGFLGIVGLAVGGIVAIFLYMLIFGFGGAIVEQFK